MAMVLFKLREVCSSASLSVPYDKEAQQNQDNNERTESDPDFRSQADRTVIKPLGVDGCDRTRRGDIDKIKREDVAFSGYGHISNRLLLTATLKDSDDWDKLATRLHENALRLNKQFARYSCPPARRHSLQPLKSAWSVTGH